MNYINQNSQRLSSIDFLRGLIIALMTLDHTRDVFNNFSIGALIGLNTPTDIFFTRWITHICAPVFVFLAGLSVYLNKNSKNFSRNQMQIFLLKRGLFLIFLEFTLISFIWNNIFHHEIYILHAQVIWAIGASMIFLSLLLFLKDWMIFFIGIFLILTNNIFDIYTGTDSIIWNFLHVSAAMNINESLVIRSVYPLYPWLGIMAAGYGFCSLFYNNKNICKDANDRKSLSLKISLILFLLFVILRFFNFYGDSSQFNHDSNFIIALKSFLEVTKYPPSLHYVLITLSIGFAILAWAENRNNKIISIFSKYGSAPFFYYIAHLSLLPVFNFLISKIFNQPYPFISANILITWIASATLVILLYPLILWFINFKKTNRHKFPILNYF